MFPKFFLAAFLFFSPITKINGQSAENNPPATITVTFPKEANFIELARRLVESGVIHRPWLFMIHAVLSPSIAPGSYSFAPNMSIDAVFKILMIPNKYKVTIPEGYTVCEIIRHLNRQPFLTGYIKAIPDEGSLLPATFDVSFEATRESVIRQMQRAMRKTLKNLWKQDSPYKAILGNTHNLVVFASIVEKESGVRDERTRIAGVFYNRLASKMPLQADPTVIYAITSGRQPLGRKLTRTDTRTPSPMNTYVQRGLPPKPIACPGKAALQAALTPDVSSDFYFVTDSYGGHYFGATLDDHNKNVQKWKKTVAEKNAF